MLTIDIKKLLVSGLELGKVQLKEVPKRRRGRHCGGVGQSVG
jgi:hypothetical protein